MYGENQAMLGFFSIGREEKGQTKQVYHVGCKLLLDIVWRRVFATQG